MLARRTVDLDSRMAPSLTYGKLSRSLMGQGPIVGKVECTESVHIAETSGQHYC